MKISKPLKIASLLLVIMMLIFSSPPQASKAIELDAPDTDKSESQTVPFTQLLGDAEQFIGTYKVEKLDDSENGENSEDVNMYASPDKTSQVQSTVKSGTYHVINKFENGFGYITYKGKSGWVEMERCIYVSHLTNESICESANNALDYIAEYEAYGTLKVEEYLSLKSAFEEFEAIMTPTSEDEQIISLASELQIKNKELLLVDEFIKNAHTDNFPKGFCFYGDVNGDNYVNLVDVVLIQRHIARITIMSGTALIAADVDGNGEIQMLDTVCMQKVSCELLLTFPIGYVFHTDT